MAIKKKEYKEISHDFELEGVNLKARDGSDRQQSLKEIFESDIEESSISRTHEITLQQYDKDGAKVFAVLVDDKEVGDLPQGSEQEAVEISQEATRTALTLSVAGHDIEEYLNIVDRYKDRAYWKKEDPNFDGTKAKKDYDEVTKAVEEGGAYSATLHFFTKEEATAEKTEKTATAKTANTGNEKEKEYIILSDEEREETQRLIKYFNILFWGGITLFIVALLFLIISPLLFAFNLIFAVFAIGYSRRYLKRLKQKIDRDDMARDGKTEAPEDKEDKKEEKKK